MYGARPNFEAGTVGFTLRQAQTTSNLEGRKL